MTASNTGNKHRHPLSRQDRSIEKRRTPLKQATVLSSFARRLILSPRSSNCRLPDSQQFNKAERSDSINLPLLPHLEDDPPVAMPEISSYNLEPKSSFCIKRIKSQRRPGLFIAKPLSRNYTTIQTPQATNSYQTEDPQPSPRESGDLTPNPLIVGESLIQSEIIDEQESIVEEAKVPNDTIPVDMFGSPPNLNLNSRGMKNIPASPPANDKENHDCEKLPYLVFGWSIFAQTQRAAHKTSMNWISPRIDVSRLCTIENLYHSN